MIVGVVRFAAATVAALLPRRYWATLDTRLPVSRAAFPSAVATLGVAALLGIPGFLRYAAVRAAQVTEVTMQATGWRPVAPGAPPPTEQMATGTWLLSFFSLFEFAFLTPLGLFTTYLAVTGILRAIAVAADDARGDPLIGFVDAMTRRAWTRARDRSEQAERERREGPEVPDRAISGKAAGLPNAEVVIVSSRRKPGWEPGVFVITSEKWYRLDEPVERETPAGLRTLYPLNELRDHEALRRGVRYEMPTVGAVREPSPRRE